MASKSKKSGSVAPQQSSQPSAPNPSVANPTNIRPTSPLSPTRHSRIVEKVELQNLNDRLACYIDRVRYLETENARLNVEVQTSQETVTRETSNIKHMYEHELSDARKLLDETAREKARLEIDTKRLWEENEDLRQRFDKAAKDLQTAEHNARSFESRVQELSNKYNSVLADKKKSADEAKQNEKELVKLRKQLDDIRKNLEEETLARVDLENTVQSLREELTFKDQIHCQEMSETRSRRQLDITEVDGRLAEQYEARLQQSLQELRDQYEEQMRANRDEIELLFETKLKNAQTANQRHIKAAANVNEEMRILRSRFDGINARISDLESINSGLNARIRELEQLLDDEKQRHIDDEAELTRLRDEMALQLQDYQDLMDIKVSLDLELAAYDKLLCGEEQRLNIKPTNSATASQMSASFSRSTPLGRRATPLRASGPSSKRKRTHIDDQTDFNDFSVTSSADGDIEIQETDSDGRFIRVHNKGEKEVAIGGWQLLHNAGTNDTSFKFHRSVKVEAGGTVTVWSSDVGATHEPPTNIVMKQQKWFGGDRTVTKLINADGKESALYERSRNIFSTRSTRVHDRDNEELYHQQGDPQGQEKCCIM